MNIATNRLKSGASPATGFAVLIVLTLVLSTTAGVLVTAFDLQPTSPEAVITTEQKTVNEKDGLLVRLQEKERLDSATVSVKPPNPESYTSLSFEESISMGRDIALRESAGTLQWAASEDERIVKSVIRPENNESSATIDYRVSLSSYEGSGAAIYAVYDDASTEIIECDGLADSGVSKAADVAPDTVACTSSTNQTWSGSTTIESSDKTIDRVVLLTQQDNTPNRYEDVVTLHRFSVASDNQITEICPVCESQKFRSQNGQNDQLSRVGEGVFVTGVRDGSRIIVVGEHNGQSKPVEQTLYRYEG